MLAAAGACATAAAAGGAGGVTGVRGGPPPASAPAPAPAPDIMRVLERIFAGEDEAQWARFVPPLVAKVVQGGGGAAQAGAAVGRCRLTPSFRS